MKRAASLFAAALMVGLLTVQAHAASLYPVSVEEYTSGPFDELRIDKVYVLSQLDDPADIPTGDFDRGGYHFTLLDVVKTEQSETDTRDYIEVVTQKTDTKDLAQIIQQLEPSIDVTTEDGYSGTLTPDYPGITVEAAGYKTSTRTVTATRYYPSLSDADTSLIPRTVEDSGRTLTLEDVQWQEAGDYYNATATYSGTASSKYATGYIVTVEYRGEVSRTSCDTVIYTATFACQGKVEASPEPSQAPIEQDQPEEQQPEEQPPEEADGFDLRWLIILPVLAGTVGLAFGGRFIYKYVKSKKEWKEYTK